VAVFLDTSACAARLASRARRQDDAPDDRLRDRAVVIEPMLQRGPDGRVDRSGHLRIVQAILRLPLELRLGDEETEDPGKALADVFSGDRDALRRETVRVDVVSDSLAEACAQAVLVCAARAGRDPVDVAAHVLVGGFGPLQHEVEPRPALALEHEWRLVHRFRAALADDLLEERRDPFLVLEGLFRALGFVLERDADALVDVAHDLEPLADRGGVEFDLGEDCRVGMEVDGRTRAACPARLLQRRGSFPPLERHLPQGAVTLDARA
jgi:hypothetical protein